MILTSKNKQKCISKGQFTQKFKMVTIDIHSSSKKYYGCVFCLLNSKEDILKEKTKDTGPPGLSLGTSAQKFYSLRESIALFLNESVVLNESFKWLGNCETD